MGIPGFFKWLTNKYCDSHITKDCVESKQGTDRPVDDTQPNPNGTEFDNFYIDMNGIIHSCTQSDNHSKSKNEDEVIKSIFDYIDRLFSVVRPRKLLYIAIDGVAPRAKLNQQRSRRYRKLKDTLETPKEIEKIKARILANGNLLPHDQGSIEHFDENSITAGTSFMIRLANCLRYYIYNRMNTNRAWRSIKVILSDANVPGEGEHKIMDFIRQQRAQSNYDPNTQHVLFGTDADLIILGLATQERYITIMRDEFTPPLCVICRQSGHDFKKCKGILRDKFAQPNNLVSNTSNHNETKYIFVDLSILCDILFESLPENDQSSFEWKPERFFDDWVFICLLVGNDFLPDLLSFEIYEEIIDNLLKIYFQKVPEFGDYLTDNGKLRLELFKTILITFGEENESAIFQNRHKNNPQRPENDQSSKVPSKPLPNLAEIKAQRDNSIPTQFRPSFNFRPPNSSANKPAEVTSSLSSAIPSNSQQIDQTKREVSSSSASNRQEELQQPDDPVRLWEEGWHERYYQNKFNVDKDHLVECCTQVVEHYTRGLCWVLQYYYHGVPSWDWYYPYHYAPFALDFKCLNNISVEFNKDSKPLKPLEQLISILPPQCSEYLPDEWKSLISEENSSISKFYPLDPSVDPNGKRYRSQYTVILPFIDENHLLKVLENYYSLLTPDETKRNKVENDLLFIHSENSDSNCLKQNLDVSSGNKITSEHPANIPPTTGISGYIWRDGSDDKITPIGKPITAPLSNYQRISNNRVMCVNYRGLTDRY